MTPSRPYTPDSLAERWGCSAETIRNMIRDGRLQGFRVGRRLFRIPAAVVEEIEQCQTLPSDGCVADSASSGGMAQEPDTVISLRHTTARQPKPRP